MKEPMSFVQGLKSVLWVNVGAVLYEEKRLEISSGFFVELG